MIDDSIAKVLMDYKKIAGDRDWKKETREVDVAISDYIQTIKDFVESQKYSRQAAMMIESLLVELEEGKVYIFALEEDIKCLNEYISQLKDGFEEPVNGNETEESMSK